MSELLQEISSKIRGDRYRVDSFVNLKPAETLPDGLTVEKIQNIDSEDNLKNYIISVSLVQGGYCLKKHLPQLENDFIKIVKTSMFDQVRRIQRELVRAFFERDVEKMGECLKEMHHEIF